MAQVVGDRATGIVLEAAIAQLLAMERNFASARRAYREARHTARELGQPILVAQLALDAGEVERRRTTATALPVTSSRTSARAPVASSSGPTGLPTADEPGTRRTTSGRPARWTATSAVHAARPGSATAPS